MQLSLWKPSTSFLDSLRVTGFRAFTDLRLEPLGRVNLIVGRNNCGKTTLLEALRVYYSRGEPDQLLEVLLSRDELSSRGPLPNVSELRPIARLFNEKAGKPFHATAITIGPDKGSAPVLTIEAAWAKWEERPDGSRTAEVVTNVSKLEDRESYEPAIKVVFGDDFERVYKASSLTENPARHFRYRSSNREANVRYVPPSGLSASEVGRRWDGVVLGPSEDVVLEALRIIDPRLERVSIVEPSRGDSRNRIAIVKRKDVDTPEPLKSLGAGLQRLLEMSLSVANATDGILLIDEIENGVHFSVQEEMWKFIYKAADEFNCQVFATTHSWDCIRAFQSVTEQGSLGGKLVRLYCKGDSIKGTVLNEEELAIATRESIEVR